MSQNTLDATTHSYEKGQALFERAKAVIPAGIYGHFNPRLHKPHGTYPLYCSRAEGARFWDVDGNEFIDYMCAYGPMILGYANPVVDEAFRTQVAQSDTCTLPSPVMVELAELLVDMISGADWAFFAKNGADVTNLAVMIARAETGRSKVIGIEGGYHGSTPWMQAADRLGTVEGDFTNVVRVPWNDLDALSNALDAHSGDVAAFISSPYHTPAFADNVLPAEGYWQSVQALLKKHGVLLISDDVRSGFRIDLRGSHAYFGYEPDLMCFCKAIANGYPISALLGSDALKSTASKVFHTGSFWFSAGPMAAGIACLNELKRLDAANSMMATGKKVFDGMVEIAGNHGLELNVTGAPSMPYLRTVHEGGIGIHEALCGECARRGLFMTSHHNLFVSAAHSDEIVERTWAIFDQACSAASQES